MTLNILENYQSFLADVLTPSRLRHSTGVMQVMGELADVYQLDRQIAMTIGLLHDAAKDFNSNQQAEMMAEAHIQIQHPCEQNYNLYLHGPISAYFVRKALGISNPLILEAIDLHTWMGELAGFDHRYVWTMRFADLLEPYRNWDDHAHFIREGIPALRESAFAGRIEEAALLHTAMVVRFFEESGEPVHPNYYRTLRMFAERKVTIQGSSEETSL